MTATGDDDRLDVDGPADMCGKQPGGEVCDLPPGHVGEHARIAVVYVSFAAAAHTPCCCACHRRPAGASVEVCGCV